MDAHGQVGTIRWAINSSSGFLLILKQSKRNDIVRSGIETAAKAWVGAFLPKRFTNYVKRAPFLYRAKSKGFILAKARGMGLMKLWIGVHFSGWDPWEGGQPPLELIKAYKLKHPDAAKLETITPAIRADAKETLTAMALAAAKDFLPLVMSGNLRQSALTRSRVEARATQHTAHAEIRIPFPATGTDAKGRPSYGYNQNVARIIRMLPAWEVKWIANIMKRAILVSARKASGHGSMTAFESQRLRNHESFGRTSVYAAPRAN